MGLLAGVCYDPAAAVAKATSALLALTALDTTNLRLNFIVPANGAVMVRLRCAVSGASTEPVILLGVLQSSTVIARQTPLGAIRGTAVTTTHTVQEALFTVSGLTAGASLTWDAAYAVQVLFAGTNIEYGGPDNSTANNAWGGFQFEVYTAPNLLGQILYDPSTAVSKSTATAIAMTALDTTNLRQTFTAPPSGNVLVRMRCAVVGASTYPQLLLGVLSGATLMGRVSPAGGLIDTAGTTIPLTMEGQFVVTGLSGSQTWDAAYGVETLIASTNMKYGGPNNASGNNAWGGFLYEIWGM